MAQYWVYLNNEVVGPYSLEQVIRLRGFSRQTMIRVDGASGKAADWISPAEIPELAHIFKAADEQHAAPTPVPMKAAPKPVVRPVAKVAAAPAPVRAAAPKSYRWVWLLLAALIAGAGAYGGLQYSMRGAQAREQAAAKALIENVQLPAASLYRTPLHYMQEKRIQPHWEFERLQEELYHVTLSWSEHNAAMIYAFETNVQAQTVRGINTAAIKLLSEGFPAPASEKSKAAALPKKSPSDLFPQASDGRRKALANGDFPAVWAYFSHRKKNEMAKAGMSQDGFLRLQNLTYRVDSGVKQTVLKTKQESEKEMLTLIKQSQSNRPDIFVKQLWVFEDEEWKLDDEEKRAAPAQASEAAAPPPSSPSAPAVPPAPDKPVPASLPGMSN